jgi:hypothetical protein
MRRRTSLAAAAALGAAWALTACGIPTDREPEVIGSAPTDFDSSPGARPEVFSPTSIAEETVENFFKAAAGDPASRDDRLNEFTVSGDVQFSDPAEDIRLVAGLTVTVNPASDFDSATVTVTGSVVGNYLQDGYVRMNPTPGDYEETFTLQRGDVDEPWKMSEQPVQAALSYEHFTSSYEQAPMYFQAGQAERLVPDLRWVYRELDAEARQRLLLSWLLAGFRDFAIGSARNAIPPNTKGKIGEDGGVEVDLSPSEAIEEETAYAIAAQIVWSLEVDGDFTLRIDGDVRVEGDSTEWRNWNAIPPNLPETAYFIAENTVWEYSAMSGVTRQPTPEHSWVGFNAEGLQQVAVGFDQLAAVVAGPGGVVLQTGASAAEMREVAGLSGVLTDPQWLDRSTLLIIDDGVPTLVLPSTGAVQPLGVGADVTAMALAADGRRLAYVEDGHAWLAPLSVDADANVTMGDPRRIGLDIENVKDVAWSSENYLWVVGERGTDQLFRVATDNSRTEAQDGTGTGQMPPINQIAANPADPERRNVDRGEPVIIVANETLYRVFASDAAQVTNEGELVGGTAPFTVLSPG